MLSINQNRPGLSQVACLRRELLRIGTLAGGLGGSCFGLGAPLVEVGDKDYERNYAFFGRSTKPYRYAGS